MNIPTMPEYANGGLVSGNVAFGNFRPSGISDEVVIRADFTPNRQTIDSIVDAIMKTVK